MQLASVDVYQEVTALTAVEQLLHDELSHALPQVETIYLYMMQSGGKRVRPLLTLLSNQLFSSDVKAAVPVAAAAEMIHMASLVHDDIIDTAAVRRGNSTINNRWDNQTAVLAGDALLARALVLLVDTQQPTIIRLMADMFRTMCEGEIAQYNSLMRVELTEAEYLARIEQKTALFFAVCCQSGALLGGCSQTDAQALWQFGRRLGLAFQMIDDLLDIGGEPDVLGKPVGADLAAGVITLPLLRAMQDEVHGEQIRSQVTSKRFLPQRSREMQLPAAQWSHNQVQQILDLVRATDALEYTRQSASELAQSALEYIPVSTDGAARTGLVEIANMVIYRAK